MAGRKDGAIEKKEQVIKDERFWRYKISRFKRGFIWP